MGLLFSPKQNPSPPHIAFNLSICPGIETRGPSPGRRPELDQLWEAVLLSVRAGRMALLVLRPLLSGELSPLPRSWCAGDTDDLVLFLPAQE